VLFQAIALPLVLEFYRVIISYDDSGIHVVSPWSRRRTLLWREISVIRWRPIAKWLDLGDGSNVVHVSPLMSGLDGFATACLSHVPRRSISSDTEGASAITLM